MRGVHSRWFQAEPAVTSVPPEDEGALREKIRGQVEYYLSRQNLLQVSTRSKSLF